jgi:hypothetical protein
MSCLKNLNNVSLIMAQILYQKQQYSYMKVNLLIGAILLCAMVSGCGDGNDRNDAGMKDPATVHPPSEAIPDSTKLVNDSVIMPDTTPNNGAQVGSSDSIRRNR